MECNACNYKKSSMPGICIAALLLVAFQPLGASMWSQVAAPVARTTEAATAAWAFDTASIKPSGPNSRGFGAGFTATGLHITSFPLSAIVLMAYLPLNTPRNPLVDMPAWAYKEFYDVDARIDEASAPAWLKLNPRQRGEPGRLMLQQLLAERCKLVAHTVPVQASGYALVIHKRGPGLQPAQPRDSYPEGVKNLDPEGGKVLSTTQSDSTTMTFFNALIPDLANLIGVTSSSIVADQTNLTGRYDFTIRRLNTPVDAEGRRINDPSPTDLWDISGTGLEIKPAKIASENLVIDHIERPSPN